MRADNHRILVRLTTHQLDGKDFRHIDFLDLIIYYAACTGKNLPLWAVCSSARLGG